MNKILYFPLIIKLFSTLIFAREPSLATLQVVYSNSNQMFSIKQHQFLCSAYGIISIDALYNEAKLDSTCRTSIEEFYLQNPRDKYYSSNMFDLRQTYHVEYKKGKCIVYIKGLNTLSELLLANGLAVKETSFNDEEFNDVFIEAQTQAKENNLGMYKNKIKYKCIAELFSIEKKALSDY